MPSPARSGPALWTAPAPPQPKRRTGRQAGAGERLRRAVEDDAPGTGQRTLQFIAVGPAGRAPGQVHAAFGSVAGRAQRRRRGGCCAVHLGHQAAGQGQVVGLLAGALIALETQHAAVVVERVDRPLATGAGLHPATMGSNENAWPLRTDRLPCTS
ncbi:hypothetical protein G6F63_014112 [Rhizopus arrhizus]|nr:hypothetical protein G6F63_014112 [Rhizopus arrhizus]